MKTIVQDYKKSINESNFTSDQVAIIWDFYVTKSMSSSASQKRKVSDYGYSKVPFDDMMQLASISDNNVKGMMADKIPETLVNLDLQISGEKGVAVEIDIDICRTAFIIPYQITDDNKPQAKSSKPEAFFSHIRNAFAHGNTYFFDNGSVLLEDKNGSITTAMILIKQQTLLDWISLIDKEQRFYILHSVSEY